MKRLIILALLIVNVCFAIKVTNAQGNLQGYVYDEDGDLSPFTNVQLVQDSLVLNVSTDLDGFFEVSRVPSGQYEMTVFSPISGNQTTIVNVYDNETEIVKVEVGSILVGDGLTVSEIELDPSKPTVQVIDVDFLNNAPIDDIEDAEKIGNGITQDKNGDLSYRGSRPGSAVYYVDGMRVEGQLNIPLMAIREIEIYNGGIPAKYGDTVGGIVAIETKSFFDDY